RLVVVRDGVELLGRDPGTDRGAHRLDRPRRDPTARADAFDLGGGVDVRSHERARTRPPDVLGSGNGCGHVSSCRYPTRDEVTGGSAEKRVKSTEPTAAGWPRVCTNERPARVKMAPDQLAST